MSATNGNEFLPGFGDIEADERRHEEYVRLSSAHFNGLSLAVTALGVELDKTSYPNISALADKLAKADLNASAEEKPDLHKRHAMELIAIGTSPLIIEAFIRYSGAKRLTDCDADELDKVIAAVQEREATFRGLLDEIATTMEEIGITSSRASTVELNAFLGDIADAMYRLRYSTPADDLDISRADTVDRFRSYAASMGLEPEFGELAVQLLSR